MNEIRFYQMTPKQQDEARARFINAGDNDEYWYLIGSDGTLFSRNKVSRIRRIFFDEGQAPSVPDYKPDFETKLIAAAPEMYELLRRFIVDDKWGVSMRADLEAARRAAELLRRLED